MLTLLEKAKILDELGYSPNDVVTLNVRIQIAYTQLSEEVVDQRVRDILTQIDTLESVELDYASDEGAALIKADVLEWDPSLRQVNLDKKKSSLVRKLSALFDLPIRSNGYGVTRVYKG